MIAPASRGSSTALLPGQGRCNGVAYGTVIGQMVARERRWRLKAFADDQAPAHCRAETFCSVQGMGAPTQRPVGQS